MENKLELRMYFLVPNNISDIYKGIMCGHASLEYVLRYGLTDELTNFITNWKTWIILDGGTTNGRRELDGIVMGSLDQIGDALLINDIKFSYFQEPDLNDALTALCFICDERIWDRENYPDLTDFICNKLSEDQKDDISDKVRLTLMSEEEIKHQYFNYYNEWKIMMGGEQNIFLRELIKNKKLA